MTYLDIWKEYGFTDVAQEDLSTWDRYKNRLLELERDGVL